MWRKLADNGKMDFHVSTVFPLTPTGVNRLIPASCINPIVYIYDISNIRCLMAAAPAEKQIDTNKTIQKFYYAFYKLFRNIPDLQEREFANKSNPQQFRFFFLNGRSRITGRTILSFTK